MKKPKPNKVGQYIDFDVHVDVHNKNKVTPIHIFNHK